MLSIGIITLLFGGLFLLWQYGVTGNPLTDPYTLWWPYDRIGFGPGIGIYPGGNTLKIGLHDARIMLQATAADLFGWKTYSWLFLPFGMIAIRRNKAGWLTLSVFVSLVCAYMLYWAQVTRYGPRYYYEGLSGLTLVSAAGIVWLAERARSGSWRVVSLILLGGLVTGLVTYNLTTYMPRRIIEIYGLYGIHQDKLAPFQSQPSAFAYPRVGLRQRWQEFYRLCRLDRVGRPLVYHAVHFCGELWASNEMPLSPNISPTDE